MGLPLPYPDHTTLSRRNATYAAVKDHSLKASIIIPPQKDAVMSPQSATALTQRDRHLLASEKVGRFNWKRTPGYDGQTHAEYAFSRYKRIFGGRLRAKREESQEREAALGCVLLNRLRELGRPQSYPVPRKITFSLTL